MAMGPPFTFGRFTTRWGFSAVLFYATYNPSGHSYFHWITTGDEGSVPLKLTAGLILLWIYLSVLPIIWASMGPVGLGMAVALCSTFGLVLWDYGLLNHVSPTYYPYALIATFATILAVGLSWGHINLQVWHLKLVRKIAPKQM